MGDDLSHKIVRAASFGVAVFAVAATIAAAMHENVALVGWLAAASAFAAAFAAGARARALNASDDLREPRKQHGPSMPAPLPEDVTRAGVFSRLWALAGGAIALLGIVPILALSRKAETSGTAWTAGARLVTPAGRPLRVDDLDVGGVETVFPEGHVGAPAAATLLLRLPPNATPGLARRDWVQSGNIAYSKICTHAGCPVAIYREQSLELYCPCHQSVFDVVDGARPVAGPATRALPQLGLDVDRAGYLIARGDYVEPVGPDSWWRTV
jgi:Rieske Fe-S protein